MHNLVIYMILFMSLSILNIDVLSRNHSKFGGRFINGKSAFLWVQTEYIFSPTCSFIRMRQEFLKQNENKLARLFNFTFYSMSFH
jgi:hypothetical protein